MWLIQCQTHTRVSSHTAQDTFFLIKHKYGSYEKKKKFKTNGLVLFAK